jgi:hypothetical protein
MLLYRLPGPLADLSADEARQMQELADRNVALRNLKAQVQQLNAEFHSVKGQVVQAEAQLLEVQELTYTAHQDAERAKNEVGLQPAGRVGCMPSSLSWMVASCQAQQFRLTQQHKETASCLQAWQRTAGGHLWCSTVCL